MNANGMNDDNAQQLRKDEIVQYFQQWLNKNDSGLKVSFLNLNHLYLFYFRTQWAIICKNFSKQWHAAHSKLAK